MIESELFRRVRIESARIKRCPSAEKRERGAAILRGLITALRREAPPPRCNRTRAASASVHLAFTQPLPVDGSSLAFPPTGNSNPAISGVGGV